MAEPDLLVHLLVPSADGRRHLATRGADGLTLPSFRVALERGDRIVTAVERALRSAWALDAAILETHLPAVADASRIDAEEEALVVLEPPAAAWVPPSNLAWNDAEHELPARIAARAATWLAELGGTSAVPALRPRWSRPGWKGRAESWIHGALTARGLRGDGPIEMRRLWGISALARVPLEGGGAAWFKAVFPHFHHEPAVTAFLGRSVPGLVPPVLATDGDEGWLLMEECGEPVGDDVGPDADALVLAAIGQLADAQLATRTRLDAFAALGCPRRPLAALAADLVTAMEQAVDLGGEAVARTRLSDVAAFVRAHAAWLDGLEMGDVLVHGDFHVGNLLVGPKRTRIIDWSDAAIAHPVVEIAPWFGEVRPDLRPTGWEAWMAALARLGPVDELTSRHAEAYAVACAYQVVSYAGILRGMEPASRHQLRDGFVGYWRDLDASVPR